MITNSKMLEDFEKKESLKTTSLPWHLRAERLYQMALKLNRDAVQNGGGEHLKMLIKVRKKMELVKKNDPGA